MSLICQFNSDEFSYLNEHFQIMMDDSDDSMDSFSSRNFIDEVKCNTYINWLTKLLKSPSRAITASQFSKKYAFLVVAPSLYAMTMYNKSFDVALDSCSIESKRNSTIWKTKLRLNHLYVTEPLYKKRNQWRDLVITNIFANNIEPILRMLHKVTGISKDILWENTAIRVFSLYEKRIGKVDCNYQQRERCQEDFDYIVNQAPGHLFGEHENPFQKFYGSRTIDLSKKAPTRIRETCCYYYKVSKNGNYCKACPKDSGEAGDGSGPVKN
ncbi:IucA/IucC family C-terminal-domain containing protein [Aquibacillus rhizosphaerae]|uniref:IucA/IucC family C-terminal-domain containing protein n=1 Tax=Aquibacillus rhizosphaerae TaxID=3051431 RepID=A0ABT7L8F5_9BACI|nr:IucA/IucC family C-terminal-domain containing protein [Aquibacillus sp. LR5S19]MDL4842147.1 IucA/IucC family C-terminal-domain containing protein [Aquibacillus sp. LR5S19]